MIQKQGEGNLENSKVSVKPWVVGVSIVITAIFVVGIMYFLQQYQISELRKSFESQLKSLDLEKQTLESRIKMLESSAKVAELAKAQAEAEMEDMAKKTCKGVWKNGICIKSTCVDSDINERPLDIYVKGNVVFTDENGVETVVYDECSGSKLQVNEMWCYESPSGSGNYVQGREVYDCAKGCLDGACVK